MDDYTRLSTGELLDALEHALADSALSDTHEGQIIRVLEANRIELEIQNRDLRDAQRELEEARDRYAELFDFAPAAYFVFDENGCIMEANLTAAGLLGEELRQPLIGRPFVQYLDPGMVNAFFAGLKRCRESQKGAELELALNKRGGSLPVAMLIAPGRSAEGAVFRAALIDLSGRKKAEEERERMRGRMLELRRMELVGRLAGGIAHEFNNLMAEINAFASLAAAEAVKPEIREYVASISASASRATSLTRQLLIFSGNRSSSPSLLDLNGLISGMNAILSGIIGHGVAIANDLEEGLPPVYADKGRIEQLILNLILNARDAMPKGGQVCISTRSAPEGGERSVALSIKDSGHGLGTEAMSRLFEPFFSTKEGGKAIGLGLTVVKNIVDECGGLIKVESHPGAGTEFIITLKASGKSLPKAGQSTGRGETILVIEDERLLRKGVALLLSKNGYRVLEACNRAEALKVFDEGGALDLVFSDVLLKDANGLDVVDELMAMRPGLRVLFTSGYMDTGAQWPAIREKGYPFLQKPYETEDLLRAVKAALSPPPLAT